jgi:hypothetical protein
MQFQQAFPVAIIDEDYDGKHAAGRGMRQRAGRRYRLPSAREVRCGWL